MMIFKVGAVTYRSAKLDARAQFFLLDRLTPLLPALDGIGSALSRRGQVSVADAVAAVAPLAQASEDDMDVILDDCFSACDFDDGGEWRSAHEIADNVDISDSLRVVASVVAHNFAPFFSRKRAEFRSKSTVALNFQPVAMPDGLDWLLRPVLRGLCRYESMLDGTLHIEDVAEMNDLLSVADENQSRAADAAEIARR